MQQLFEEHDVCFRGGELGSKQFSGERLRECGDAGECELRTEFCESKSCCSGGFWFSKFVVGWAELGVLRASVVGSELAVVKVYMCGMGARV